MNSLTIDGKDYLINEDVAELIVMISKERDKLKTNKVDSGDEFRYVKITTTGCEDWINLFFGDDVLCMVENKYLANRIITNIDRQHDSVKPVDESLVEECHQIEHDYFLMDNPEEDYMEVIISLIQSRSAVESINLPNSLPLSARKDIINAITVESMEGDTELFKLIHKDLKMRGEDGVVDISDFIWRKLSRRISPPLDDTEG